MADTCAWTGRSGTAYSYLVYDLPCSFNPNQPGNYIYAKMVSGRWVPVYIGEGDLRERCGENHHQAACIKRCGATHFHAHLKETQKDRLAEEQDLLSSHTRAYAPQGCNEKPSG